MTPRRPSEEEDTALRYIQKGEQLVLQQCLHNLGIVIGSVLSGLRYNARRGAIEVVGGPCLTKDQPSVVAVGNSYVAEFTRWLSTKYKWEYEAKKVLQYLETYAQRNYYDPLEAYLNGISWDSISRVDSLCPKYLGSADTPWARVVGRRWMISAVARALQLRSEGAKVDTMLILEGAQGIKKSSALAVLAGAFFVELNDVQNPDTRYIIRPAWITEMSEIHAYRKVDVNRFKSFLSAKFDDYRPPWALTARRFYRGCVFVGTTNDAHYLADATGERRFWPVKVEREIDLRALEGDRDQLWAEAVVMYRAHKAAEFAAKTCDPAARATYENYQWWLTDQETILANVETRDRGVDDPVAQQMEQWAAKKKPGERAAGFTVRTIIVDALGGGSVDIIMRGYETKVGLALRRLRWTRHDGKPPRWFPPADAVGVVPEAGPVIQPPPVPTSSQVVPPPDGRVLHLLSGLSSGAFRGKGPAPGG